MRPSIDVIVIYRARSEIDVDSIYDDNYFALVSAQCAETIERAIVGEK